MVKSFNIIALTKKGIYTHVRTQVLYLICLPFPLFIQSDISSFGLSAFETNTLGFIVNVHSADVYLESSCLKLKKKKKKNFVR